MDAASGEILFSTPAPESGQRLLDPNPRGGTRGARGIAATPTRLAIANTDEIFVVDPTWRLVHRLSHPLAGGIHDILLDEDGVWATSTNADLLVKLAWDGTLADEWEWRRDRRLAEALSLPRVRPVDRGVDYRRPGSLRTTVGNVVHLNAVTRGPEGLLLSFGRVLARRTYRRRRVTTSAARLAALLPGRGATPKPAAPPAPLPAQRLTGSSSAIVALDHQRRARILRHDVETEVPNHNVVWWRDRLVYCDSNAGRVVVTGRDGRGISNAVPIPGSPGFVRGLAHVGEASFLVGNQSPAAIYLVDVVEGAVLRTYELGGEPTESVYSVAVLPPEFSMPSRADWLTGGLASP